MLTFCDAKWAKFLVTFVRTFTENFAVKFERFFELNLLVENKFHFILSRSRMNSFALHKYRSYLFMTVKGFTVVAPELSVRVVLNRLSDLLNYS